MGKGPELIGDVLAQLQARRGFAAVHTAALCEEAWREAAGELAARYCRVGAIRRGTLEVTVANSTLLQELSFQKPALLRTLANLVPDKRINGLRLRVGPID